MEFKEAVVPESVLVNSDEFELGFEYKKNLSLVDYQGEEIKYKTSVREGLKYFCITNELLDTLSFGLIGLKNSANDVVTPIRIPGKNSIKFNFVGKEKQFLLTANELLTVSEYNNNSLILEDVFIKNGSIVFKTNSSVHQYQSDYFYFKNVQNDKIVSGVTSNDEVSFSLRLLKNGIYELNMDGLLNISPDILKNIIMGSINLSIYVNLMGKLVIEVTDKMMASVAQIDNKSIAIDIKFKNITETYCKAVMVIQSNNIVEYISKFKLLDTERSHQRVDIDFAFNDFIPKNNLSKMFIVLIDKYGRQKYLPLMVNNKKVIGNNKYASINELNEIYFLSKIVIPINTENKINELVKSPLPYLIFRERETVDENIVLFESFFGSGIGDNPAGIYNLITDNIDLANKTIVWAINDVDAFINITPSEVLNSIKVVKWNSIEYQNILATAKIIINNTSISPYFSRRESQRLIQTWHGVPLKHLGKDMRNTKGANRNIIRSLAQATDFINPNVFTERKVIETLDLWDISKANRILQPYARNVVENPLAPKSYFSKNKKNVVFAPTWKGDNNNVTDNSEKISEIYKLIIKQFDPEKYTVYLKAHLNSVKYFKDSEYDFLLIDNNVPTEYVLDNTDILISDYSSIMFDFIETQNKPVISYAYDLEEYTRKFGIYPETLTMYDLWIAKDEQEFIAMLNNIDKYPYIKSNWIAPSYTPAQKQELLNIFDTNNLQSVHNADKVNILVVEVNEMMRNPALVRKINARAKNLPKNQRLMLFHIGLYSNDAVFEELDDSILNFYRVFGYNITSEVSYIMYKLDNHIELTPSEDIRMKEISKIELDRSFGNIDIDSIEFLSDHLQNTLMAQFLIPGLELKKIGDSNRHAE